jgi:hypothetical protein
MADPYVRALQRVYLDLRDICGTVRDDVIHGRQAIQDMRTVQKAFEAARAQAMQTQQMRLHQKIHRGEINIFRALTQHTSHPALHRLNPAMDHSRGILFWQSVFSVPSQKPAALHRCYCDNIAFSVTPVMLSRAFAQMKNSAPGPDKVPMRLIQLYSRELALPLCAAFTRALREGTPEALREAETLFFAKPGKASSADPSDYRPITLQPVLVRILHKIVDLELRDIIFGTYQGSVWEWMGGCKLFHGQGGFQRYKGATDQALFLHILVAAQRALGHRKCLFGLFLDIQKAFDSLDHGHFLDICEHGLHLSPEWLEILRKLLLGNYTRIFGHRIDITRGSEQGSPLSPLICLIYLNDLAETLLRHFHDHPPSHPFHMPHVPGLDAHWLLLILLLFADDICLLGLTLPELEAVLNVVEEWATSRGLRFSPKGFAEVLSGSAEIPDSLPTLSAHGHPLHWIDPEPGIGRYMGVPFWVYKRQRRYDAKFPFPLTNEDTDAFHKLVVRIYRCFELPNGQRMVFIPGLTNCQTDPLCQGAVPCGCG